jgi:hypothetical protein
MNVLIVHLTEELIASQATEPGNPWSVISCRSTHIRLLLTVCVKIICKTKFNFMKNNGLLQFRSKDIITKRKLISQHWSLMLRRVRSKSNQGSIPCRPDPPWKQRAVSKNQILRVVVIIIIIIKNLKKSKKKERKHTHTHTHTHTVVRVGGVVHGAAKATSSRGRSGWRRRQKRRPLNVPSVPVLKHSETIIATSPLLLAPLVHEHNIPPLPPTHAKWKKKHFDLVCLSLSHSLPSLFSEFLFYVCVRVLVWYEYVGSDSGCAVFLALATSTLSRFFLSEVPIGPVAQYVDPRGPGLEFWKPTKGRRRWVACVCVLGDGMRWVWQWPQQPKCCRVGYFLS